MQEKRRVRDGIVSRSEGREDVKAGDETKDVSLPERVGFGHEPSSE